MRRQQRLSEGTQARILVLAQFGLIALILLTTGFQTDFWAMTCMAFALLLLLWGVAAMRRSKLRVSPIPAKDASLVRSGPYRLIRHPMYTSVLLGSIGLLIMDFEQWRLAIAFLLFIVLSIKLRFEENLLSNRFPDYPQYMRETCKLIPYIY